MNNLVFYNCFLTNINKVVLVNIIVSIKQLLYIWLEVHIIGFDLLRSHILHEMIMVIYMKLPAPTSIVFGLSVHLSPVVDTHLSLDFFQILYMFFFIKLTPSLNMGLV